MGEGFLLGVSMTLPKVSIGVPPQVGPKAEPQIVIDLGLETTAIMVAAGFVIYDRLVRPIVLKRLLSSSHPLDEQKKLNELVAQLGGITQSDRILLWTFHNGELDSALGYHYAKATVTNSWLKDPSDANIAHRTNVPFGLIRDEIETLLDDPLSTQMMVREADCNCESDLAPDQATLVFNRLIKIVNVPLGLVSVQYDMPSEDRKRVAVQAVLGQGETSILFNKVIAQIDKVMKGRAVRPSLMEQLKSYLVKRIKG